MTRLGTPVDSRSQNLERKIWTLPLPPILLNHWSQLLRATGPGIKSVASVA